MATIQEIAKRAGTSVATVSHVINRTRFVSDELRGRGAGHGGAGCAKAGAWEDHGGLLLRNYRCSFAEDLIDALHCCGDIHNREELSHRVVGPGDIEVVSILVKTEMTLQELKTYQKRYGLDYIILDYTVRLVQTRYHETVEAPIVFLNHDPKVYPRCYHINFDYRAAMVAALRHMVSLGHRNILVITPKENPYTNRLVLETCKLFYKQNHMVFPDENLVEIETYLFRTLALENLDQVLGTLQSRGITGIITTEMMATMHVVDYLQHQGVTMPQDISLLAIGDIFLTKYLFFNRTRIDMRIIEVGAGYHQNNKRGRRAAVFQHLAGVHHRGQHQGTGF
ncbi:MAG: LacI family DNA-binding transcriptional regulator [Angelakisella sp.]